MSVSVYICVSVRVSLCECVLGGVCQGVYVCECGCGECKSACMFVGW